MEVSVLNDPIVDVRVTRAVYYNGKDTVVGKKMKMPLAHAKYLECAKAVQIIEKSKKDE